MHNIIIDYGRGPARLLGARLWKVVLVLVAGSAVVGLGPSALHHLRLRSLEQQCRQFAAPADLMAFYGAKSGSAAQRHYQARYPGLNCGNGWQAFRACCWEEYLAAIRTNVQGLWNVPNDPWITLFLHERTASNGTQRLISIELLYDLEMPEVFVIAVATVEPGGWNGGTGSVRYIHGTAQAYIPREHPLNDLNVALNAGTDSRIFMGQPDLNDASHFTVKVEIDRKLSYLDGWLQNDGGVQLGSMMGRPASCESFNRCWPTACTTANTPIIPLNRGRRTITLWWP